MDRAGVGPVTYPVTFTETGLPEGTAWSVTVDNSTNSSSAPSIVFQEPNGTGYQYTAGPVNGYSPPPYLGFFNVSGSPVNLTVPYTPVTVTTYPIDFPEAGLPSGTNWSIEVNGSTFSGVMNSIVVKEPNGTDYEFAVGSIDHYGVRPATGTFNVSGRALTVPILFYWDGPPPPTITAFNASPAAATLGETVAFSVAISGGVPPLTFAYLGLPEGCRSVNASNLTCVPSVTTSTTVTVVVSDPLGRQAEANASLTVNPPAPRGPPAILGLPGYEGYGLVGAAAAVLAVAVLVVMRRQRRERKGKDTTSAEPGQ